MAMWRTLTFSVRLSQWSAPIFTEHGNRHVYKNTWNVQISQPWYWLQYFLCAVLYCLSFTSSVSVVQRKNLFNVKQEDEQTGGQEGTVCFFVLFSSVHLVQWNLELHRMDERLLSFFLTKCISDYYFDLCFSQKKFTLTSVSKNWESITFQPPPYTFLHL